MADADKNFPSTLHRRNPLHRNPETDINILLLGETGVGKTTFINALANYLVYNDLDSALRGEMQVLIASTFSVANSETHDMTTITVGTRDKNELCEDNGQSQTQGCKSYLFPIGDRYLRLIDTPGVADVRGIQQDNQNFAHVLAFISRYKHLNGICVLLKPNNNRLDLSFRYIIKESLKHLQVNAKKHIMFVFTNARANFYAPGATATQLRTLLASIQSTAQITIPFDRENTFILDNEAFRYLAVRKSGHHFYDAQMTYFVESWERSVKELHRLMARIVSCGLYAVHDMKSLNEAQQMINKLPRPIAEVATLIEENKLLAGEHRRKISQNTNDITANQLPENIAEVVLLKHPRTVCASRKCSTVTEIDGVKRVDYKVKCHRRCYLQGTEQEVLKNPLLKNCSMMNKITGECEKCGCLWDEHIHVTYKFRKRLTYRTIKDEPSRILTNIDQYTNQLKDEQEIIRHICNKLRIFIRANSLNPTNDAVIEYINHCIHQEKQKYNPGDVNSDVIRALENLIGEYQDEFKLMSAKKDNNGNTSDVPTVEDVFACKWQLFELPISGKYFQQQMDGLDLDQVNQMGEREVYANLPRTARLSTNMQQLEKMIKQ